MLIERKRKVDCVAEEAKGQMGSLGNLTNPECKLVRLPDFLFHFVYSKRLYLRLSMPDEQFVQ